MLDGINESKKVPIQFHVSGISDKMPNIIQTKSFGDTFLYFKNNKLYEKQLMTYIMNGEVIDVNDESFEDIRYLVKKNQITSYLVRILDSPLIKLMYHTVPMPKIFKVITAKDLKNNKKPKIFIDVSDIFVKQNGVWKCRNIDIFIAYLISAGNQIIYYADPRRMLMKDSIMTDGATAFSSLFTYVIDYLFKVTAVSSIRDKCVYLSAMYYMVNILHKEINDTVRAKCIKIAQISVREEDMIRISIDEDNMYNNIDTFIKGLAEYLRLPKLTIDAFLEKWIYIYGTGTQFALELYTSFIEMITNVYVGCYLNNQKTIEKIIGRKVVAITQTVMRVCDESI